MAKTKEAADVTDEKDVAEVVTDELTSAVVAPDDTDIDAATDPAPEVDPDAEPESPESDDVEITIIGAATNPVRIWSNGRIVFSAPIGDIVTINRNQLETLTEMGVYYEET